jgi:hypothetical protein
MCKPPRKTDALRTPESAGHSALFQWQEQFSPPAAVTCTRWLVTSSADGVVALGQRSAGNALLTGATEDQDEVSCCCTHCRSFQR